ncbi:MAG: hypothetical protein AB1486_33575 [Planctomycetota bacterium]
MVRRPLRSLLWITGSSLQDMKAAMQSMRANEAREGSPDLSLFVQEEMSQVLEVAAASGKVLAM